MVRPISAGLAAIAANSQNRIIWRFRLALATTSGKALCHSIGLSTCRTDRLYICDRSITFHQSRCTCLPAELKKRAWKD